MHCIDLSQPLDGTASLYPGMPLPERELIAALDRNGFVESRLSFSSHTATHMDFPAHMMAEGKNLTDYDIGDFIGRGLVLDVSSFAGGTIAKEWLLPSEAAIRQAAFVLFYSGWSGFWGTADYLHAYPVLSVEAAAWLARLPVRGIGVDMISVDDADATSFPVHMALLEAGKVIIENLNSLFSVLDCSFTFCSFPIKLGNIEAAPVRAVALLDGQTADTDPLTGLSVRR